MKKKPTVINSFEQLNEVLPHIGDIYQKEVPKTIGNPTGIEEYRITNITETKRVSLLAKSKRRY